MDSISTHTEEAMRFLKELIKKDHSYKEKAGEFVILYKPIQMSDGSISSPYTPSHGMIDTWHFWDMYESRTEAIQFVTILRDKFPVKCIFEVLEIPIAI